MSLHAHRIGMQSKIYDKTVFVANTLNDNDRENDILITLTDLELPVVMSVSHDRVTRVVVAVVGGAGGLMQELTNS